MLVTVLGIVTDFKDVQPSNALLAMQVRESGMTMDCKDVHTSKAP